MFLRTSTLDKSSIRQGLSHSPLGPRLPCFTGFRPGGLRTRIPTNSDTVTSVSSITFLFKETLLTRGRSIPLSSSLSRSLKERDSKGRRIRWDHVHRQRGQFVLSVKEGGVVRDSTTGLSRTSKERWRLEREVGRSVDREWTVGVVPLHRGREPLRSRESLCPRGVGDHQLLSTMPQQHVQNPRGDQVRPPSLLRALGLVTLVLGVRDCPSVPVPPRVTAVSRCAVHLSR